MNKTEISKYRKKPIIIEATQYTGSNNPFGAAKVNPDTGRSYIETMHGGQIVVLERGDWVIPDGKPNTYYPCKPDIFEKTYEPVVAQFPVTTSHSIKEFDRCVRALALELPAPVWDDVSKRWNEVKAASQSPAGWVRAIADIRNKLYEAIPTVDVKAWDLVNIIKWHINDLDNLCSRMDETPSHTEGEAVAADVMEVFNKYFKPAKVGSMSEKDISRILSAMKEYADITHKNL